MKKQIDNGGSAFPTLTTGKSSIEGGTWIPDMTDGMSLRDWFAGQALAGVRVCDYEQSSVAKRCYDIADAMLKERSK